MLQVASVAFTESINIFNNEKMPEDNYGKLVQSLKQEFSLLNYMIRHEWNKIVFSSNALKDLYQGLYQFLCTEAEQNCDDC